MHKGAVNLLRSTPKGPQRHPFLRLVLPLHNAAAFCCLFCLNEFVHRRSRAIVRGGKMRYFCSGTMRLRWWALLLFGTVVTASSAYYEGKLIQALNLTCQ